MIAYLQGQLAEAQPTRIVVDCHGVGYAVLIPVSSYDKLPAPGQPVKVLTHHHVIAQDGTHQLYGFMTAGEREMFLLLIGVNGIGPKAAINILSSASLSALRGAIAGGDTKMLASLRGIGKKTAERLVVELKDKIGGENLPAPAARPASPADQKLADAVLALVSLGYKQADAQSAVATAREQAGAEVTVETLVRHALRGGR